MISDRIDVLVEDYGEEVLLGLRGHFGLRQMAAVREKLEMLVEGPGKIWFFDLEHCHFQHEEYLDLFLDLLNRIKGKSGVMVLLFRSSDNHRFFDRLRNVFSIYDSRESYHHSGIFHRLKQTGLVYSRRTGLRLSPGVAIVLVVLLAGWMMTLFSVLHYQEKEIRFRETRIQELENQKREYSREIYELRSAIGPLRDLGVMVDSTGDRTLGTLTDWIQYLERMEARRREK